MTSAGTYRGTERPSSGSPYTRASGGEPVTPGVPVGGTYRGVERPTFTGPRGPEPRMDPAAAAGRPGFPPVDGGWDRPFPGPYAPDGPAKKKGGVWVKVLVGILLAVLFAAAVVGVLGYCGVIDIPFLSASDEDHEWQKQYDMGLRYLNEGNYQEAILSFDAAIRIDPRRSDAYVALAETYVKTGDPERALQILDQVPSDVDNPYAVEEKRRQIQEKIDNRPPDEGSSSQNIPDDAVEYDGHYYYIIEEETPEDAEEWCEENDGHLATITTPEENEAVEEYIEEQDCESVVIGMTDRDDEGNWQWVNDEPYQYENWAYGEPDNSHDKDYAAVDSDGRWHASDGDDTWYLCEWDREYTPAPQDISDERNIALVLDVSGSMDGDPIQQTRTAASNFVQTILNEDASIGVVSYDNSAQRLSDFSRQRDSLTQIIENLYAGGGTNIEAGLRNAHEMLNATGAKKKIIVLMSDGEPNNGLEGEALIAYADQIKAQGVVIYTLGFFENLSYKSSAQYLMEQIASEGCHYEVSSAEDIVFFFGDMADQINGQKYIYIRIACPVDVSVTYQGQTLSSAEYDRNTRTDFGTLTFEQSEDGYANGEDDQIKILRLKDGADYDVRIDGTGHGLMDYTIGFMDENGDYSDLRRFEDIKITKKTVIDTVAAVSDESVLHIDRDGDGEYDKEFAAEKNGYGVEVQRSSTLTIVIVVIVIVLLAGAGLTAVLVLRGKRKKEEEA